ncbi:heavy metal-binding domain-containing protein [Tessaracoccus massiliensis]|uniref:heavy metal-binding domain-containing protein n=1 Tax=Tessaracoccus massiliensis TaxID=1522311 RepID=UPI000693A8DA|nr:heavy metal-binding domain-containing protein [Tessaracoccus massiliensis]
MPSGGQQGAQFAQPTPKPGPPAGIQPSAQPTGSAPVAPAPVASAPAASALSPSRPEPISPQPQRDTEPRRPHFVTYPIPVATTESLPGHQIGQTLGVVIGVATRPRDMAHNPEMGFVNTAARQDAIGALVQQAQEAGADAVVGLRFDGGKISDTVTELTAYGTAVRFS